MKALVLSFFVLLIVSCSPGSEAIPEKTDTAGQQPVAANELGKRIDRFNDDFKYDSSLLLLQQQKEGANDSIEFVCYFYESRTYKRLFKYDEVLRCLDSARKCALRCTNPDEFLNKETAERAFALFDIRRYDEAGDLMNGLRATNFKWLSNQQRAFLIMQEGYLAYRKKDYRRAQSLYTEAIQVIQLENKVDLPVIYGKQIELYMAQHKNDSAYAVYEQALRSADESGIIKYKMYATDMMRLGFLDRQDYKEAYRFIHIGDSLVEIYNKTKHINTLAELETKYQTRHKEQALINSRNKEMADQRLIAFLLSALIVLVLSILLFFIVRKQRKAIRERKLQQHFTAMMFKKTEEERQRIAADLHDGISHELLQLKEATGSVEANKQIDHVINEIRAISRNLHPAMFERVGLKLSLEQLAERIEEQHNFLISLELDYQKSLSTATELQLYRIVQEAINNIVKHAGAHAALISLKSSADHTQLIIKDNGTGFVVSEKMNSTSSFGIHNITERAEAIGGKVQFESGAEGTTITITIRNPKK